MQQLANLESKNNFPLIIRFNNYILEQLIHPLKLRHTNKVDLFNNLLLI